MQILLDTHIFLWWLKNDRRLTKKARKLIMDANVAYISSVSMWEIAIKVQLGKLEIDVENTLNLIESEGFIELPLSGKQAALITQLPNYHRDPFDRILIAQAMSEPLRFLTADKMLKPYSELIEVI